MTRNSDTRAPVPEPPSPPPPTAPHQASRSRRDVLRIAGLSIGAVVVTAAAGTGIRAALNGAFSAGDGRPYDLWATWDAMSGIDRIVAAGVLAANPHNTQPWVISVVANTISISADPTRRMPACDARDREHFAGLGCAIENMVVAARAVGSPVTVDLLPDGSSPDLVARLTIGPEGTATAAAADTTLAAAIPLRHTNRGPYTGAPVSDDDLSALGAAASDLPGVSVTWVTDNAARQGLGDLYVEATEAIVGDEAQSLEAFSWFRNDRADIDAHRDGLTLDCQGLDSTTLFLAKVLPAQSRTEGDAFWVKSTREVHTATAAAYGIVTVTDVLSRADQINGGRMLNRVHLAATAASLGFHHMNQITERIDQDAALGQPDVFSARWEAATGIAASSGLVAFRLGHPGRPAGLSPRRALSAVIGE